MKRLAVTDIDFEFVTYKHWKIKEVRSFLVVIQLLHRLMLAEIMKIRPNLCNFPTAWSRTRKKGV